MAEIIQHIDSPRFEGDALQERAFYDVPIIIPTSYETPEESGEK